MTATNKNIPGKRIKTWHRNWGRAGHGSLREFARALLKMGGKEAETARKWLDGKGVRHA